MFRAMSIQPSDIRNRAYAARVSINRLMKRAAVPNSTFWRWETGRVNKPHPITLARIVEALEAFEAEKAA